MRNSRKRWVSSRSRHNGRPFLFFDGDEKQNMALERDDSPRPQHWQLDDEQSGERLIYSAWQGLKLLDVVSWTRSSNMWHSTLCECVSK